ncbi:uncharacterized protein FFE2_05906 [Fusarium fujikuroi]|nr:uncharacterized protein FFE2_05906 [Fusarium fujikuroi]
MSAKLTGNIPINGSGLAGTVVRRQREETSKAGLIAML